MQERSMEEKGEARQVIFYTSPNHTGESELKAYLKRLSQNGFTVRTEECPLLFEESGAAPVLRFAGGLRLFGVSNIQRYLEWLLESPEVT